MTEEQNQILIAQNAPRQLERLAAKTLLYGRAEVIQWIQAILPSLNALIWPPVLAWKPDLKVWAAFCGLILPSLDSFGLDAMQKRLKLLAAKIQELFDCEVLAIDWNKLKVSDPPTHETVVAAASSFGGDRSKLVDWYPNNIAPLPVHLARIVCQRSNCWWDAQLRRNYGWSIIGVLCVAAVLALTIGLIRGMTLESFVLGVVAPLAPAFLWGIREYKRQMETADESERLLRSAEAMYDRAISNLDAPEASTNASRNLQDQIFDRRRTNPVNPSFWYGRKRLRYQEQMERGAEEMVRVYRQGRRD